MTKNPLSDLFSISELQGLKIDKKLDWIKSLNSNAPLDSDHWLEGLSMELYNVFNSFSMGNLVTTSD